MEIGRLDLRMLIPSWLDENLWRDVDTFDQQASAPERAHASRTTHA